MANFPISSPDDMFDLTKAMTATSATFAIAARNTSLWTGGTASFSNNAVVPQSYSLTAKNFAVASPTSIVTVTKRPTSGQLFPRSA